MSKMSPRRRGPAARPAAALLALALLAAACSSGGKAGSSAADHAIGHPTIDTGQKTAAASFEVVGGVESATVTGAAPKARLTLVDGGGHKLLTEVADAKGQAVFAYIPDDYTSIVTGTGDAPPTSEGTTLKKGRGYTVRDESADPVTVTKPFAVLGRDDHPPTSLYDGQQLPSVAYSIVGGQPADPGAKPADGFGYITVRDGVKLSTIVHLPDPSIYGPGPYPTVMEYSGYGVSNPDNPQPGSMIANALGYATVGVNMRGTAALAACSTSSTRPSRPTATTPSRPSRASPGSRATRSAWSGCRTRASPSSTWPPPGRPA